MDDAALLIVLHFAAIALALFMFGVIAITGTAAPWPLFFKVALLGAMTAAIRKD
jgi:hypothetical protein